MGSPGHLSMKVLSAALAGCAGMWPPLPQVLCKGFVMGSNSVLQAGLTSTTAKLTMAFPSQKIGQSPVCFLQLV